MVENRRWLNVLAHAILLLGGAVLAFPIYVTFVASTSEMRDIIQPPLPLVPGPHLLDNYSEALQHGVAPAAGATVADRQRVVMGKRAAVRVSHGCLRSLKTIIKKQINAGHNK